MKAVIKPTSLNGSVGAIPSKSYMHRLLICCALAENESEFDLPVTCADIEATCSCLRALSADITKSSNSIHVKPIRNVPSSPLLDCYESGSTLRFLLPVASVLTDKVAFTGQGRLPSRPLSALTDEMKRHGISFSDDSLPFTVSGRLTGGEFNIAGNVSSQYITGLLLALPKADTDSTVNITSPLESSGYVDITLRVLKKFNINIQSENSKYIIKGFQKFTAPPKIDIDRDWSNAAFFLAAGAISGCISVEGLDDTSSQGDKKIISILSDFGALIEKDKKSFTVRPEALTGCDIDISGIPDLLPILAVTAAFANKKSTFYNAGRLRLKESDRLLSTSALINSLGGKTEVTEDTITVYGTGLRGGTVDSFNDHRIVMAAAIAACSCKEQVIITGAQAVNKSYPTFFDDYKKLGGNVYVL